MRIYPEAKNLQFGIKTIGRAQLNVLVSFVIAVPPDDSHLPEYRWLHYLPMTH